MKTAHLEHVILPQNDKKHSKCYAGTKLELMA